MINQPSDVTAIEGVRAAVPCTCGELFQGALDGLPCLVSCPIDIYSRAQIIGPGECLETGLGEKAKKALQWINRRTGRTLKARVKNPLPAGRGFGASTADIGATLFAAGRASGWDLTPNEASQAAVRIEPTDSTLFPGLTLFDHLGGGFETYLGEPPPARLIILDPGGLVDSETYNRVNRREIFHRLAAEHRDAFRLLQQGVATGDLQAIGEAATLSARIHQSILYNPWVDEAFRLAKMFGAVGTVRAHSGTVVGLLFPVVVDDGPIVRLINDQYMEKITIILAGLTTGGPRYDPMIEEREAVFS